MDKTPNMKVWQGVGGNERFFPHYLLLTKETEKTYEEQQKKKRKILKF